MFSPFTLPFFLALCGLLAGASGRGQKLSLVWDLMDLWRKKLHSLAKSVSLPPSFPHEQRYRETWELILGGNLRGAWELILGQWGNLRGTWELILGGGTPGGPGR